MSTVIEYNATKLRVGDVVFMRGEGGEHIVTLVNHSRAHVVPVTDNAVQYKTVAGKEVQFNATRRGMDISPNSEIPILQRLGEGGMKEFFEKRKEERAQQREERRKEKEEKEGKPKQKRGKFGGILGHSVVKVLRAMGKHKWDEDKAAKALKKQGIDASPFTIKRGIKRGREGTAPAADLSKAQLETLLKKKVTE